MCKWLVFVVGDCVGVEFVLVVGVGVEGFDEFGIGDDVGWVVQVCVGNDDGWKCGLYEEDVLWRYEVLNFIELCWCIFQVLVWGYELSYE